MAYTKTNWVNGTTPLSASNMNNIETGIEDAHTALASKANYAFKTIAVSGQSSVVADQKDDTLTLVAGSNVTLTTDATNDKVTIAATNTTYSNATTSTAGLMSATDKTKLDGLASGTAKMLTMPEVSSVYDRDRNVSAGSFATIRFGGAAYNSTCLGILGIALRTSSTDDAEVFMCSFNREWFGTSSDGNQGFSVMVYNPSAETITIKKDYSYVWAIYTT